MLESLILLSLIATIGLSIRYFINRYAQTKLKINNIHKKITTLNNKIIKQIENRKGEIYYIPLKESYKKIKDRVSNINIKINTRTLKCLNGTLILMDNYNIHLNKNLNKVDDFLYFKEKFSNKKSKYRKKFNKSIKILDIIVDKYGDNILKYVQEFNKDYDAYKQNEILKLNKYVNKCKTFIEEYDFKSLNNLYSDIKQIDNDLIIKLTEPVRLYDKLNTSEESVEQLETELDNKKGSLYNKTFNIIKNYKVTQEETYEWNGLKKKINYYKKNRLLKNDIIKLNKDLNQIINSMSDLCDKIIDNASFKKGTKKLEVNINENQFL